MPLHIEEAAEDSKQSATYQITMESVKKKLLYMKKKLVTIQNNIQESEAELAEKLSAVKEVEAQMVAYMKQEKQMEQQLKTSEEDYHTITDRMILAEKCVVDVRKSLKNQEERLVRDSDVAEKLENEIMQLNMMSIEMENKRNLIGMENAKNEAFLLTEEERIAELEEKVKYLEFQINQISGTLRYAENSGSASSGRNSIREIKIREMRENIRESLERARVEEIKCAEMVNLVEEREEKLRNVKENYLKLKSEFDSVVLEVGDM